MGILFLVAMTGLTLLFTAYLNLICSSCESDNAIKNRKPWGI